MVHHKLSWGRRAAWAMSVAALAAVGCGDDDEGEGTGGTSASSATSGNSGGSTSDGGGPSGSGGVGAAGGAGSTAATGGTGPASSSGMGGGTTADCTPNGDACLDCVKASCCAQLGACAAMDPTGCQCWWECQNNSSGNEPNMKCFDDCGPFSEVAQGLVLCTQNNCTVCKQ